MVAYGRYIYFGAFEGDGNGSSQIRTTDQISAGQWYHVVATKTGYNTATFGMYVNGTVANITQVADPVPVGTDGMNNLAPARLGFDSYMGTPQDYATGVMRNVKVYNRTLSATEVASNYNGGCITDNTVTNGLIYYAKLNEGTGNTVTDFSGNNLTCNISNGSWSYESNPGTGIGADLLEMSFPNFNVPNDSVSHYVSDIVSSTDYYAFGQAMPGRRFSNEKYRYGFNGKENDNEVKGTGNQQDYGMRIYDPRLGRFLSVDPITSEYPELTPYQFGSNRPIDGIDLDGLEWMKFKLTEENGKPVLKTTSAEVYFETAVGYKAFENQTYSVEYNNHFYSFSTPEQMAAFVTSNHTGAATDLQKYLPELVNGFLVANQMYGEALNDAANSALSKNSVNDYDAPLVSQPSSNPSTTAPKGMNNPKVRAAVAEGKTQHKLLDAKVQAKGNGWKSTPTYKDPKTGKTLYPDVETPSGNLLEYKPKTPSGIKKGASQSKKYEEATGKKTRVIYYTPQQKKDGS